MVFEVTLHTTGSSIVPTLVSTLAKVEKQPKPKRPNAAKRGPKAPIIKGLTPSQLKKQRSAFADELSKSVRKPARTSARQAASTISAKSKKEYMNWIRKHHNMSDPYWQLVARGIQTNK